MFETIFHYLFISSRQTSLVIHFRFCVTWLLFTQSWMRKKMYLWWKYSSFNVGGLNIDYMKSFTQWMYICQDISVTGTSHDTSLRLRMKRTFSINWSEVLFDIHPPAARRLLILITNITIEIVWIINHNDQIFNVILHGYWLLLNIIFTFPVKSYWKLIECFFPLTNHC